LFVWGAVWIVELAFDRLSTGVIGRVNGCTDSAANPEGSDFFDPLLLFCNDHVIDVFALGVFAGLSGGQ
jgi:hypothetical protein